MNLDDYSTVDDSMRYINPQVSLDEQNAFIKNLREVQSADTAQIAQETHDLGTDVPSNLGGLTGSEGYFASRYQTPQTNALVADLRATAQAQALNDAMSNELAKAKRKYNNAYKAAQKRAKSSTSSATPADPSNGPVEPDVEYEDTTGGNIWSHASETDDTATYGLYQLRRNEGESDDAWNKRKSKWLSDMIMQNKFRSDVKVKASNL